MPIFFIPFITLAIAEVLKTITESIKARKFQPRWFLRSGGMPSGHSSFTTSIATVVGYTKGLDSPEFLLAFGFAFIVMYDARGVRMAVSRHAKILNHITPKVEKTFFHKGENPHLEESVGHTELQVIAGATVGIIVSIILLKYI